jgi:DNA modification methylase
MKNKRKNDSSKLSFRTDMFSDAELNELEISAQKNGFPSISEYLLSLHRGKNSRQEKYFTDEEKSSNTPEVFFKTDLGKIITGDASRVMQEIIPPQSVDLIMTSPPFGLVRKKAYGNEDADDYVAWFRKFAEGFQRILKPQGSLVIDIGGAWKKGQPTRSLYHFELLISLSRDFGFHLAQEFYWWNPSKLPSPAEWVNVRRIRVKDAVNCIWWLSPTPFPKASNKRVLQPYSDSMQKLLKDGYTAKLRPSGHDISTNFKKNNSGAIPPNLIALANTESNSKYQRYCRENKLPEHPARFPEGIPAYFIRMLTDKNDLVFDPFAGSCMTGSVAEKMKRQWLCCEIDPQYTKGALGRFESNGNGDSGGRSEPYNIYPPILDIIEEKDSPLPKDGGKKRPKKRKK